MLLLHGLTQQSHAFDAVAARLARRHRCLALDLRGRGESGWAPGTYTIPQYVADVLALLDALGLDAVHVLGTSLGGLVGLSLAGGGAGSPPLPRPQRHRARDRPARRRAGRGVRGRRPGGLPDLAGAAAWALAQYPWLAGLPPEAVADAIRWAVRRAPDGGWRLKFDPAIGRAPRPSPEAARAASQAWWAALEALRCPVLLVRGAESDILSPETAAADGGAAAAVSAASTSTGVGHAPDPRGADRRRRARRLLPRRVDQPAAGRLTRRGRRPTRGPMIECRGHGAATRSAGRPARRRAAASDAASPTRRARRSPAWCVAEVPVARSADGLFAEIARATADGGVQGLEGFRPVQWNWSLLQPGAVKAWHLHLDQEDLFLLKISKTILAIDMTSIVS